ncbi:FHA domain-containing protein [Halorubrum ezzemoulense]|uniref:FHA domain-containing protein n=1 Tax=Halorubrum ezzemoulense TaxID=337243 RepID=UPI00138AF268|nr:FHA domain-containing protein [Halorubrum ezzemoulense]
MSREHLQFTVQNGVYYVTDMNSSNGTQLNGQKLAPQQQYQLSDGDNLNLGTVADATVELN